MNRPQYHAIFLLIWTLFVGCEPSTPPLKNAPQATSSSPSSPEMSQGEVYLLAPLDGATVYEDVFVRLGVTGYHLTQPGTPSSASSGHHHLLIDAQPIPAGEKIPVSQSQILLDHVETEATLHLSPGRHSITAQYSDSENRSLGPTMSKTINIEVLPSPKRQRVFFVEPEPGAHLSSPVRVVFGIEGMRIEPAGQTPGSRVSGHHHLLIDAEPIPIGMLVPMSEAHQHFDRGEHETILTLEPGPHTLTLQLADGGHLSHGESMSQSIDVLIR